MIYPKYILASQNQAPGPSGEFFGPDAPRWRLREVEVAAPGLRASAQVLERVLRSWVFASRCTRWPE